MMLPHSVSQLTAFPPSHPPSLTAAFPPSLSSLTSFLRVNFASVFGVEASGSFLSVAAGLGVYCGVMEGGRAAVKRGKGVDMSLDQYTVAEGRHC